MENSPPSEFTPSISLDRDSTRAIVSAGILTAVGDFLLWSANPGISIGLFALALAVALFLNRDKTARTRTAAIVTALLALTVVQTGIELSRSNLLVLLLLGVALVGETSFPAFRTSWTRWAEGTWAIMRAPLVWCWGRSALSQVRIEPKKVQGASTVFIQVGVPTLVIVLLFTMLLGGGNAVFAKGISDVMGRVSELIPSISFGRLVLWVVLATFTLSVLHPVLSRSGEKKWERSIPSLPEPPDLRIARWRSLSILAALNALFFAVNTIDAVYLWIHGKLPADVSYSEFVHQGVHSLVAAVLLSAFVLAVIYQQAPSVIKSKGLRILALIWIAQNIALLASVLLRLKLYVDAYHLSELRIYVACFLLLVAVGFGLLARRIIAEKTFGWLVLSNALATFALFFALQFLDVSRWVADYNVTRWQQDRSRTLDVKYLASLESSAYPYLIAVAETAGRPEAHEAFVAVQKLKAFEQKRLARLNWRSWQARVIRNARLLVDHEVRTQRI